MTGLAWIAAALATVMLAVAEPAYVANVIAWLFIAVVLSTLCALLVAGVVGMANRQDKR